MTDPVDTQQAPESNDISDLSTLIENQFDDLEAAATEEEVAEETEVEAAGEEVAEESSDTSAESAEESSAEPMTAEEQEKLEDEAPDYSKPAPERWPAELKEAYDKLPPEARQLMMEQVYQPMQAQYTKSTQELAEMRDTVGPMLEAMNQHQQAFEQAGINPVAAFQRQMQWAAHFAAVGQEQGLRDMAQAFGVDLAQQQQASETEEYLTPVERRMKAELDALKQGMQGQQEAAQQYQQQQAQAQQQQRVAETRDGLQSFINETENGLPAHPHVEKLAPKMAGLIRGGVVPRVDQTGNVIPIRDVVANAYSMAMNLDPSTRKASAPQGQVERAAAANRTVETKVPAGQVDVQAGPISNDISAIYDQLQKRG